MPKMVLKTYEEINANRRKLRIIFLLISIPYLIVVGFLIFKISTLYVTGNTVIQQYSEKNYDKALVTAESQKQSNFVEQWLPYYNAGTVLAQRGDLEKAAKQYNISLKLVDDEVKECYIRANLSTVYEKLADNYSANDNTEKADQYYWLVSRTVKQAPQVCFPPENGGTGEKNSEDSKTGSQMVDTDSQAQDKRDQNAQKEQTEQSNQEQNNNESGTDKVRDGLDQANKDREQDNRSDQSPNQIGTDGGSDNSDNNGTKKPW